MISLLRMTDECSLMECFVLMFPRSLRPQRHLGCRIVLAAYCCASADGWLSQRPGLCAVLGGVVADHAVDSAVS